ncbi:MAG: ShlB/FhaC/HecB family hemolysin secretion/activation protein, partial [Verrucomicrobiota bacterium]|nr:ShlB/FhaC/HecB family hemolysin secretion/activation protein [Verrucomicrobiota bacterium]
KGIVIVSDAKTIKAAGRPGLTGVFIEGSDFLAKEKVEGALKSYFGLPLSAEDLIGLQKTLVKLCRAEDRPIVDVVVPEQEIVDGVIQIVVITAKIGAVTVMNEGEKHVPDEKVLNTFKLKAGEEISAAKTGEAADWFNRHPFRSVDIGYKRGAVGSSDVILTVNDKRPWKFYSTLENTGTKALGKNQVAAGTTWALPHNRDQIMSYEYRTDTHGTKLKSHILGYQYLLPSKHYLNLTGYYSETSAAVNELFNGMTQDGESWLGSIRYGMPLAQSPSYKPELQFGFDFKKADSNLLYGGSSVFALPTETLQFVTSYQAKTQDRYGVSAFNIDAVWSPGDLTNRNEDTAFSKASRKNSTADYLYYRGRWERNTPLPGDLNWIAQVSVQYSSQKLPPAEQLGVGGYTSVRGYDERYVNGDTGLILRNEIYLPTWKPLSVFGYDLESDRLRVLGFLDYGTIKLSKYEGGDEGLDDAGKNFNIASYGWGIRYNLRENLSFRFDHGFQLSERHRTRSDSMAHFSLSLTY